MGDEFSLLCCFNVRGYMNKIKIKNVYMSAPTFFWRSMNFPLTLKRFFVIISLNLFQAFNTANEVHLPIYRQRTSPWRRKRCISILPRHLFF